MTDRATFWAQGYRAYVIHTGSMEPTLMPGTLIVDGPPRGDYRRGEVITFRHSDLTTDVVTHRVAGIRPDGLIDTKGDANRTADAWHIRPDQVRGHTVRAVPYLGYLVVYLQHPAGIASIVTVTLAIVLLYGLFFPPETVSADDREPQRGSGWRPLPRPERVTP